MESENWSLLHLLLGLVIMGILIVTLALVMKTTFAALLASALMFFFVTLQEVDRELALLYAIATFFVVYVAFRMIKLGFTSLSQSSLGFDSISSRENGTDLSSKPSPSSRKGAGKEFLYGAIVLAVLLIVGTSLQPVFDVIWEISRFLIGLPFLIVAYIFMS